MSNMSDKEKFDFIFKAITRTDSYINYSNTKSTLILALSGILLSFILGKIDSFSHIENECISLILKLLFLSVIIGLSNSIFNSLKSIYPYTGSSKGKNKLSFIDIKSNFDETSYINAIKENIDFNEETIELSHLHFNLAASLSDKYKMQKKAINSIIFSLLMILAIVFIYLFK